MNGEKKYGFGWLVGPALFVVGVAALLVTWKMLEPSHLVRLFDQDGRSPFELATLPFYAAIIPLVWWKCPFDGSRTRRNVLCLGGIKGHAFGIRVRSTGREPAGTYCASWSAWSPSWRS